MRVGRNEPCPCGSGRKYKSCCFGKARAGSKWMTVAVAAIAVAGAGLAVYSVVNRGDDSLRARDVAAARPAPRASTPAPGPAPAGKVWSPEHGHWHDAPNSPAAAATPAAAGVAPLTPGANPIQVRPGVTVTPSAPTTPPPGPAPAGKVWSAEHGHWHDVPATAATTATAPATTTSPFTPAPQPPGPVPPGKVWSVEHGHWHDVPKQ